MSSRKDKGRIDGPFVPMLKDTTASAAWRAMSPYARVIYVALKSRYSIKAKNNGRIYLSSRHAAEETGFGKNTAARALRELSHYGFIVMMKAGCLGVDGRGTASHWRLTELGYMTDPPTRDFNRWDGTIFREQKSLGRYKRKKQNPVPLNDTECTAGGDIPSYPHAVQSSDEAYHRTVHATSYACTTERDISRINYSVDVESCQSVQCNKSNPPSSLSLQVKDYEVALGLAALGRASWKGR
jgi:hypothetical protein